jgi:hypothetical protein
MFGFPFGFGGGMNDGGGWIWVPGLGPVWVPPWRPFGTSFSNIQAPDSSGASPVSPESMDLFARHRCSAEECKELQSYITLLQEELKVAPTGSKAALVREIRQLQAEKRSCGCR